MDAINRFNYRLMSALANANATAWTVYVLIFAIIKVWTISPPHSLGEWLNAIVQTLYQGAALPLIAFVSKVSGESTDRKIDEIHEAAVASRAEAQEERSRMLALLEEISAIRKDEETDNKMMQAIMAKLDIAVDDACSEVLP